MKKPHFMLALFLCLAVISPGFAQEATVPADPVATTDTAPQGDAASGTDLSLGTEVGGEDGPGSTYVAANFDSWEQRCVRAAEGSVDTCQLYQLLKDADGNSVAEITMFGLPEGQEAAAGATVIAPLETLLTEGLLLQVDTGKAKAYPFTWCSTIGCVARIGLTAAEVEALKKGAKATLIIVPVVAPTEKVLLDVSLKGFTAGFAAVNDNNAKADATAAPAP